MTSRRYARIIDQASVSGRRSGTLRQQGPFPAHATQRHPISREARMARTRTYCRFRVQIPSARRRLRQVTDCLCFHQLPPLLFISPATAPLVRMSVEQLRPFPTHFRLKDLTAISAPVFEFKTNPHEVEAARATMDWFDKSVALSSSRRRYWDLTHDHQTGVTSTME